LPHWGAAISGWLPGIALDIGIVSFGLADLLPHAALKQMQIYLRPDKFTGFSFQFSQIHAVRSIFKFFFCEDKERP